MIGKCDICGKFKLVVTRHEIMDGPGSGGIYDVCKKCPVPKSFNEKWGISTDLKKGAKFVKFVGKAEITFNQYGANAYGSVLAENDDGSKFPVICGHGGSAWLCLKCAEKINEEGL